MSDLDLQWLMVGGGVGGGGGAIITKIGAAHLSILN